MNLKLKEKGKNLFYFFCGAILSFCIYSYILKIPTNTSYKCKSDIILADSTFIPQGSYISKVSEFPEGFSIYALYFKSWAGKENKLFQFDNKMKNKLKAVWIDEKNNNYSN